MNKLKEGISRDEIIAGFLNAQEFNELSKQFGVESIEGVDQLNPYTGIKGYVYRFYKVVLNRDPDKEGLNDWIQKLQNKEQRGGDIAKGFFGSLEFKNKGYGDEDFVDMCYKAFFNRDADAKGKSDGLKAIDNGKTREDILNGFIGSQEFKDLAEKFGILP